MKIFIRILQFAGVLVGLVLLASIGLFIATSGAHSVPDTVATVPTIPHVEIDGVVFHAETFGDPQNPVVVVVHGGPGGDYGYLLNLHQLEDDYFVVFYDQRCAGLSPRVVRAVAEIFDRGLAPDCHPLWEGGASLFGRPFP